MQISRYLSFHHWGTLSENLRFSPPARGGQIFWEGVRMIVERFIYFVTSLFWFLWRIIVLYIILDNFKGFFGWKEVASLKIIISFLLIYSISTLLSPKFSNILLNTHQHGQDKLDKLSLIFINSYGSTDLPYKKRCDIFYQTSNHIFSFHRNYLKTLYYKDFYDYK